ncbi:4-diphosphocytidyl-2C-methyl-D-erythritol kinase [Gloeothece citriformis PCC 7424]|uniref:4-diphosphocytidyl-2-C-methyl-D-erythritol kinase n=1 Tax=Gloeothece citriformis (strain PCC 7424) TaxID=65393 RepID=ISPE_GLOC7|nr:4-(cytidine 5'-diphospho)-2-C-methyl-D-erythritol kinase [Gloeothece citriformis]B7K961.1 RecName: Full=4-diphosphocytidyl-2-C-methyl-D-erythritol kinase; Short=CMK; AltName: Full=4-(cytidine-5'-diphospho)-2-C-methyl-D-erythritol kinase [Gloeothece citriformis PCC 7424]ACK72830.1 4-diphosphocytidyl-2C-methyl-D-erythritol kinase [Gloeothece citriformis PCC 7424]
MHAYTLIAPGKINLYLEIIGDRPDGYHELIMILQSIDLADRITLRPNGVQQFRLYCSHPQVPTDESNLAYRAAKLMQQEFPKQFDNFGGVDITIDKRIPVAAGLAGGSTNGAAVLVGLNLIWQLGLTQPELQGLASLLGSDVPFCVSGGTAIATGRGEQLDPIYDLDNLWVVLAKYTSIAVSTPWAYKTYRQLFNNTYISDRERIQARTHQVHAGPLMGAILQKDGAKIGRLLHNDLEKVVLPEYPQVAHLRETMAKMGGFGTMMSGSGPTVFTLCESYAQAEKIKQHIRENISDIDLQLWVAQLSNMGIQVEIAG